MSILISLLTKLESLSDEELNKLLVNLPNDESDTTLQFITYTLEDLINAVIIFKKIEYDKENTEFYKNSIENLIITKIDG